MKPPPPRPPGSGYTTSIPRVNSKGDVADFVLWALKAPPIADVIVYDAEGRALRRLDGLTREEKPL